MSAVTVAVSEAVYQRLHRLSTQAGQSPEAILDQALADYEGKLLPGDHRVQGPRASFEAELLDDPGRIRTPPREVRTIVARVRTVGRPAPRLSGEEE